MKKVFLFILIIIAVLAAGLIIFRDTLIKNGIEKGVREMVQQEITVGSISTGLLATDLLIKNLEVYNPAGYTEKILLESPEIYVDYVLTDVIKGFLHFPEVRLNIREVNVEKDKNGVENISYFRPAGGKAKKKETSGETTFLVNKLVLNIGTIRYQDNTKTPPVKKEFNINLSKTMTDIDSADVIAAAVLQGVTEQLISEGISMTVKAFMEDEAFQKALKSGDTGAIKKEGEGVVKGLIKQFEGAAPEEDTEGEEPEETKSVEDIFGGLFKK